MLVRVPTVMRPASRRWPAWARAATAALALHAWLLGGGSADIGRSEPRTPTLDVRRPEVTARILDVTRPIPAPALVPMPPAAVAGPRPAVRTPVAVQPRAAAVTAPSDAPMRTANEDPPQTQSMARPDPDEATPPPVYQTRLPPAFVRHYAVQRGGRSGHSELQFTRDDSGYRIGWSSRWSGREELGLASRGGIDEAGLAPERFADRRRGRERQAANFDRSGARIIYSGPQVEHPLLAGAQDRVSWMVQLPAIIDADPAAFGAAGTPVHLQVTGARGDAGIWTFVVQGREDLALPAGPVHGALHLVREARRPYDTRVEVWLDATRHHLPVQVRLTPVPAGEPLELQLDVAPAPTR